MEVSWHILWSNQITVMKEILIFVAGVVFSSLGYLIKRRLEKSSVLEDLEIQLKLLEINKQKKEQNVTDADMEKMRARLIKRKPESTKIIEFAEAPPELRTQADMYEYAIKEYRILESDLNSTLKLLLADRDDLSQKALEQSQLAWLEYRNKQAQLASDQYKGGSIAPLIYVTEASSLTRQRIAELRQLLVP